MKHNPKSYLILLVEDEPLSRAVLGRQLEKSGYRVNAVASAEEAIDELKKGLPAIVLLDIKLPGMSGLELLEWLRREYRTRRLPVIMISALSETGDIVRGLEMKANDYVAKPINMPILLARIGTQLTISDMIIRLETQSKILARMASLDELTGVFNRRSLIEILKIEVERSIRYTTP
ncbi:MAG: response regulator, partial [Candidatus Auribacterota bacterium]|nr:response regulator [Candidatus Auribacterota bacterium]